VLHLLTAIVSPHRVDDVVAALRQQDTLGMTLSEVTVHGLDLAPAAETVASRPLPQVRFEVVVQTFDAQRTLDAVVDVVGAGGDDGRAWLVAVDELERIRTGETGLNAL
jgi:nitrogen regulatory protein P-II 1